MSEAPPPLAPVLDGRKPPIVPAAPVNRWKADVALAAISFVWGATFVIVKNALDDASALLFLSLRFALAAALLVFFARRVRVTRRLATASVIVGASLFFGYLFQTWGLVLTTPSKSAFITGFYIVLVPVFVGIVFRRFPGWGPVSGVVAASSGLYLLTKPGVDASLNPGDLLTLACAVAFAIHIILLGHYTRTLPAAGLAAGQVLVVFALATVSVPWAEPLRVQFSAGLVFAIIVTGVFATALAFFVQTWAQQFTTPTHTALIFSMEPVFALVVSWMILGERFTGAGWVGAALILAGILVAELFTARKG
jgi:drug/metabolite transporter (DMT)-like permease